MEFKKKQKIVAIDFDGTIHDNKHPVEGMKMGEPIEDAKQALLKFKNRGYKIIIFCYWATNSKNISVISDWLKYYGIKFDEITNIKPNAEFFIDDRAIKFDNWQHVFTEMEIKW